MNWKIRLSLLGILIALFAHAYLTLHYYPLHLGIAEEGGICSINDKFNCNAVSASPFSSAFEIPLAVWGLGMHIILLIMLLVYFLHFTENPRRTLRFLLILAGASAITSIVMATISLLFLKTYCLFCIIAYASSFLIFESLRREQSEPFFAHIAEDVKALFTTHRWNLLFFVAIPAAAFFIHQFFIQHYGAENLQEMVQASVTEWQYNKTKTDFSLPALLREGSSPESSLMTIVEFADFRCGHCRMASIPLDSFVKAKSDVQFKFYAYPLDSTCNSSISRGDGLSCRLAKAVYCAQSQNLGWPLHHLIYAHQDDINRKQSTDEVDWEIKQLGEPLGLKFESLKTCMDQAETHEIIKAQAQLGSLAHVEGTPTIFVNGTLLPRGQVLPVLERVYNVIKKDSPASQPHH